MSKIVFLSRLYYPHVGGVERHVQFLSRELVKQGHKVTVVTEQYQEDLPLKQKLEGVQITRVPYFALGSKRRMWRYMLTQKDVLKKADVIHIHDVFWWYLPLRILMWHKPVFLTFHGYEGSEPPTAKIVMLRKMYEMLSVKVICVGEFMKKWYKTKPALVTYGAAQVRLQPLVSKKNAVYVGRLSVDAGILVYVKALNLLKDEIFLDVYGDGKQKQEAEQLVIDHHLPVAFHGWQENISGVYKTARYAFCSRYLAIVEAMQSKRLVVAVYNNEIKKDYLMCHPMSQAMLIAGNFTELADRLNTLPKEEEMEMIEKAYGWAKKQTWKKLAGEYTALWGI